MNRPDRHDFTSCGAALLLALVPFALACSQESKAPASGKSASAPPTAPATPAAQPKPATESAKAPVNAAPPAAAPAPQNEKVAASTPAATPPANAAQAKPPAPQNLQPGQQAAPVSAQQQPAPGTPTPQAPVVNAGPPAKLDVDKTDHDFGTVVEGEVVKHIFNMKSSGEGNLTITQAKPTCGCTIGRLSVKGADGTMKLYKFGDPIPPGTDLEMEAELNTKGKHSAASSKINIFCNDPRQTITLGLSAMVDTYFRITPANVDFGEVSTRDVVDKTVEIAGKKPGPFLLSLQPRPLPQGLKCELKPVDPNADGKAERWTIKLTLGPDAREGNMGYPLPLESDQIVEGAQPGADGKQPRYTATVMVTARVKGLITFDPPYLSFGLVRPGQVMAKTVKLQSYDPGFQLGAIQARIVGPNDQTPEFKYKDSFTVTSRPTADGKAVEVEITLNGLPEGTDGAFQGRVIIETGHKDKPEIPISFSGVSRANAKAAGATPQTPPGNPPAGNTPTGGGL